MSIYLEMGKKYAADFEKDNIGFCKGLPGVPVAMQILSSCYEIFVRGNKIKKIEALAKEEKNIMWETAKEIADGRITNNEGMIRLCTCLYALEFILTF